MTLFTVAALSEIRPGYQRPVSMSRARKYAARYDANQVRKPIVSVREDEAVTVVDGQHTVAMFGVLYGQGYEVDCETRHNLSYADEASLYVRLNRDRMDNSAIEEFTALLEAGDADSQRVSAILEKHGFHVVNSRNGPARPGNLRAIKTAIDLANRDEALLAQVLMLISDTCYGEAQSTDAAFLRGIAGMLLAENIDLKRLHRVLTDYEPSYFRRVAGGGSAARQCYERLADRYNHKLQSEARRVTIIPPVGL